MTISTHENECLFGEIVNDEMVLNEAGRIVQSVWEELPVHFSGVELDSFVALPNHLHGVLFIESGSKDEESKPKGSATDTSPVLRPRSLGAVIGSFKSAATKRINQNQDTPGRKVWLRNYYEHIIRDADDLIRIRKYISGNPTNWAQDPENSKI